MIGVWRASSSRKQSCPYGASITWSSTSLPARERSGQLLEPAGGYSQSELNAISSVLAATLRSACVQLAAAALSREVETKVRARCKIGVGVEALHERVGLVAQVALDFELGLREHVADVIRELQASRNFSLSEEAER